MRGRVSFAFAMGARNVITGPIRASRTIEPGEELTFDYATEGEPMFPCRCRPGCTTML